MINCHDKLRFELTCKFPVFLFNYVLFLNSDVNTENIKLDLFDLIKKYRHKSY